MILNLIHAELNKYGTYLLYLAANSSSGSQVMVARNLDGEFVCSCQACHYQKKERNCEHVCAAEHFFEHEIRDKICGNQNGDCICNRVRGHSGDHQMKISNGSCTGWMSYVGKPGPLMQRTFEVTATVAAEEFPVFTPKKRRIVVMEES